MYKRTTLTTAGADPTATVTHRVVTPLLEVEVQEFQDVYLVRVYFRGKERLFASDVVKPVIGWLGRKWHQWMEERYWKEEERLELGRPEVEHYDYWH